MTALAVPHPHPEESRIDIAIKLAAANVPPENDGTGNPKECPRQQKKYDERNDGDILKRVAIDTDCTDKCYVGEGDEEPTPYEYNGTGGPEKKDDSYVDKTGEEYLLKRNILLENGNPGIILDERLWDLRKHGYNANQRNRGHLSKRTGEYFDEEEDPSCKRDVEYAPHGSYHPCSRLGKRYDDFFEGIDTDYLFSKRNILVEDDENPSLPNECLWKFKKDNDCVEGGHENKLQKREEDNSLQADDQNYWGLKRGEEYTDEADYDYILSRGKDYFDEKEDECLKKIYESYYNGDRGKYLKKGYICPPSSNGEVGCGQPYKAWGVNEDEDDYFSYSNEGYHDEEDNVIDEMNSYLHGIEGSGDKSGLRDGKPLAHPISEDPGNLPAKNDYYCETTEDSPKVVDVVEIANEFKYGEEMLQCGARSMGNSNCMKLGELRTAQLGICSFYDEWFVYCDNVGRYVLELNRLCKSEINGVWRVGGTIFHEDRKGKMIVY